MSRFHHRRVNTELPVYNPNAEDFVIPSTLRTSTLPQNKEESLRSFKPAKEFVLGAEVAQADFLRYNSLKDKHLNHYFSSRKRRNLLENNGLITKDAFIIERTTCIRDCEKYKAIPPEKARDLVLEPVDNGTRILSLQLPQIRDFSPARSKSVERTAINEKIFELKRQKSTVNGIFPIYSNMPQSLKASKTARSKSPPKQFLYCQTPNMELDFVEEKKYLRKIKIKETPKTHLKISPSAANLYNTLKPLSKDELTSSFAKFKSRAQPDAEQHKVMLIEQAQKDIFKSNSLSKRNSKSTLKPRRMESLKKIALKKYDLPNFQADIVDDELVINKYSKPAPESKDVINPGGHNFSFAPSNDLEQRIDTKESFPPIERENNIHNVSKDDKFSSNFHLENSGRPIEESIIQKTIEESLMQKIEESFNFSGVSPQKNTHH